MQLHYRGQSFDFQPSLDRSLKVAGTLTRTLTDRGNTYTCTLSEAKPARLPRAINWRYSLPCEASTGILTPTH